MKGYSIIDGLMKRTLKEKSLARPIVIHYADGTVLDIPKECCTRTGLFRKGVAKAIMLKDYNKLANQYGVKITKANVA